MALSTWRMRWSSWTTGAGGEGGPSVSILKPRELVGSYEGYGLGAGARQNGRLAVVKREKELARLAKMAMSGSGRGRDGEAAEGWWRGVDGEKAESWRRWR